MFITKIIYKILFLKSKKKKTQKLVKFSFDYVYILISLILTFYQETLFNIADIVIFLFKFTYKILKYKIFHNLNEVFT